MAAGVPVIASDAGGVPEIIDPEGRAEQVGPGVRRSELGMLVTPGDSRALAAAMSWALDHPEACAAMALAAQKSAADRFSIDLTASVVAAVWEGAARQTHPVVRG